MELTRHGVWRIRGRTKMRVKDVLSIVAGGAAVRLESGSGNRYFLFYSPPDKQAKIAITSPNGMHLISIWASDFHLPAGVQAVTPRLERQARTLLEQFLFARAKGAVQRIEPRKLEVKIEVRVEHQVVYTHNAGQITVQEAETLGSISRALTTHLSQIARLIEAHKEMATGRIKYVIRLYGPGIVRPLKTYFTLKHDLLIEKLFPTA